MPKGLKRTGQTKSGYRAQTPHEILIAGRETMWAGWIEECAIIQDKFNDELLDMMHKFMDEANGQRSKG